VVDIPDVVKYANVGDHRLRGFWVAGGQISPSPIDFHRRPYNTLALPCERVIVGTSTVPVVALRSSGSSTLCRARFPMMDRELCRAMGCRKQEDDGSHCFLEWKNDCLFVFVAGISAV